MKIFMHTKDGDEFEATYLVRYTTCRDQWALLYSGHLNQALCQNFDDSKELSNQQITKFWEFIKTWPVDNYSAKYIGPIEKTSYYFMGPENIEILVQDIDYVWVENV